MITVQKIGEEPTKVSQNWYAWRISIDKDLTRLGKLQGENLKAENWNCNESFGNYRAFKGSANKYPINYPDFQ